MKMNIIVNNETYGRYKILKGKTVDIEFIGKLLDLYEEVIKEEEKDE